MDQGKPSILGPPKALPLIDNKSNKLPIRRISPAQMEEWKKKKGLCYNCDEKWGLGHKCKNAMLFLLDCVESVPNNGSGIRIVELEEGGENSVTGCSLNGQEGSVEEVGIILYALSGTPTSGTMRVMGRIMHKSLVILIDSGSTHNFVDTSLFSQLHILVEFWK